MSSTRGLTAKGVPPLPFFVIILRFVVLGLSLGVLIASAYALSVFGGYLIGYSGPPGFMIFITIKSFIVLGATMAVEQWAPQIYYRLAVIIAYSISIIFWLSGWAWSASGAALVLGYGYGSGSFYTRYGGGMAAGAALGAVAWVLMIIILVFYIRACLADPDGTGVPAQSGAELGHVKQEATTTVTPVQPYVQPQAGPYAPAQVPQQQYGYGQPQQQPYAPPQ